MSIEWFLKLKEIDSLTKMRLSEIKQKQDQENRLSKLLTTKNEKESESEDLKHKLLGVRNEIAHIESSIKQASEQRQRLMDIGGDEAKIAKFADDIASWEEAGLLLLEQEEEVQTAIADTRVFLQGLEKSTLEIANEAEAAIKQHQGMIQQYEMRIQLLTEELPDQFQNLLKKIMSKNLAHGPFTRIEQGSCYFCRFKISRLDESQIDMQKELKTCPQCTRIFLPFGS